MKALVSRLAGILPGLFNHLNHRGRQKSLELLKHYQTENRPVQLQFQGEAEYYPCQIVALNEQRGVMVVSNLSSAPAPVALRKPGKVMLTAGGSRSEVYMPSRFLEPLIESNMQFWMLTIPSQSHPAHQRQSQESGFRLN